jgi:voltage-gated potassium channel
VGLRVSHAIWPGTSAVEGMVEALDRAESEALVNGPGTGLRPWVIVRGLLRTVLNAAVMVAIYYVVPLEGRSTVFLLLELGIGLSLLAVMITWQVRAIVGSEHPGIRASYALAATTPMFLLLFSAAYVILSLNDSAAFSEPLSRSDSIYFTVTVFSTVGFGDITPVSEAARLVAVAQMILDLVVLGLGVRLILSAVQRGRAARAAAEVGSGEDGEGTAG